MFRRYTWVVVILSFTVGFTSGCGRAADPIVVANCTSQGNSEAVCSCAGGKTKRNAESGMYENFVKILEGAKRIGEESDLSSDIAAVNSGDPFKALAFQQKMMKIMFQAGKEEGLTEAETLGVLTTVGNIMESAIGECRS